MDLEHGRQGALSSERSVARVFDHIPQLPKLQNTDDIEHFLTTFERLAEVYKWPKEDWAIHLVPLLTGKARSAFVAMSPAYTSDYEKVKDILKKYEVNAETYRLRFRTLNTPADKSPMELCVCLKDLFSKWVKFNESTKRDLMETMVLEQYLRVLYPEVRTWVKERDPVTAEEAAKLVEAYVAAHKGFSETFRYAGSLQAARGKSEGSGGSSYFHSQAQILHPTHPKPTPPKATVPIDTCSTQPNTEVICYNCGKPGHTSPHCPLKKPKSARLCYVPRPTPTTDDSSTREPTITVLLNGKLLTALVDTGCTRTLVQAQYIARDLWSEDTVSVCCVHGDKADLPTAEVYIEVNKQPYLMNVGVAANLPYPILLGKDMPVLADLVQETAWCGVVTRAQAKNVTQSSKESVQSTLREMPFFTEESVGETGVSKEYRLQKRRNWVADLIDSSEPLQFELVEPEISESKLIIPDELAKVQRD